MQNLNVLTSDIVTLKIISSGAWGVKGDQPMQSREEVLNYPELELFWDEADETRA